MERLFQALISSALWPQICFGANRRTRLHPLLALAACIFVRRPILAAKKREVVGKKRLRRFFRRKAYEKPGMRCCLQMASAVCRSRSAVCRFGNLQTADFLQTWEKHERAAVAHWQPPRTLDKAHGSLPPRRIGSFLIRSRDLHHFQTEPLFCPKHS